MFKLLSTLVQINFLVNSFVLALNSSPDCQILNHEVSENDRNDIVNEHNRIRNMIMDGSVPNQPAGTNLKTMVWDDQLANSAQSVADTCLFEHQIEPDDRWDAVGQNLYTFMSTSEDQSSSWPDAINNWYDEYQNYEYSNNYQSPSGHYTQLVWANTDHVGCGYTKYLDNDQYNHLFVCNYGPAGNYEGQFPYETK